MSIFCYSSLHSNSLTCNAYTAVAHSVHTAGAILENSPRVGVIPINDTPRHALLTIFLSFYSQRVQKPFQRTLPPVF